MSVALITGCSSGFGEAIALAFAKQGYQIIAALRRPETIPAALAALVAERPDDVMIAPLDVTDAQKRKHIVDLAIQRFGRLDVLINNAGISTLGSVEDTPEAVWRALFETNFFGPLELMRLVLPVMRRQGAGRIINITSPAALIATPLLSAYSASKQALDSVSAALDIETHGFGVRVTTVMPGPFKTQLNAKSLELDSSESYTAMVARFQSVFGAVLSRAPQDLSPVAHAALAAASDPDPAARYTAGTAGVAILEPILQAMAAVRMFGRHLTGQND